MKDRKKEGKKDRRKKEKRKKVGEIGIRNYRISKYIFPVKETVNTHPYQLGKWAINAAAACTTSAVDDACACLCVYRYMHLCVCARGQ